MYEFFISNLNYLLETLVSRIKHIKRILGLGVDSFHPYTSGSSLFL